MRNFVTILCFVLLMALPTEAKSYRVRDIENVQLSDRSRFVSNPDGIISPSAQATLDSLCYSLRHRGIAQVAIVVVEDIEPNDPFSFAMELFESWGVGNKKSDNGLGILLVKNAHEIRFVTGYGLEGVLPDALCVRIQRHYMLPHFRAEDYSTGMVEGLRAIDQLLTGGELDQGISDDYEEEVNLVLVLIITAFLVLLPLILVIIHERQASKCPTCGRVGLRVAEKIVVKDTPTERTTIERLVCPYCGSEHRRTKHEDKHRGGGGPIFIGGFGGGRGFGGGEGFGGGGFGGGSFGGGGGGSRW